MPRLGARIGDQVLDLGAASSGSPWHELLDRSSLDALLAAGPDAWRAVHRAVGDWAEEATSLIPLDTLELCLPFTVADYVDFYASEHHARNLGRMFRPGQPPLPANWRYQPLGYHGRAGTIVVSGTDVVRPHGHVATPDGAGWTATERLDVEVEVGYVVGVASRRGSRLSTAAFPMHVFGVVLMNDWSARDIQAFETVPLGPFLGKSFQTSISAWVTPLDGFGAARVWPPSYDDSSLSAYLVEDQPWGLDIDLQLAVNGEVVSRPAYRTMHWSGAQLLAHLTANGASVRTGDLYASGTVSGPCEDEVGSLIERWHGERFLADGDVVTIRGRAPGDRGTTVELGEVVGRVVSA